MNIIRNILLSVAVLGISGAAIFALASNRNTVNEMRATQDKLEQKIAQIETVASPSPMVTPTPAVTASPKPTESPKIMPKEEKPTPTATPKATEQPKQDSGSISLKAVANESGVLITWSVSGIDPKSAYKILKSDSGDPVYPGSEYRFIQDQKSSGSYSFTWDIKDGKEHNFRICQYANGKCAAYSNTVRVKAN